MDQPVGGSQRYSTGLKASWVLAFLAPAVGLPLTMGLDAAHVSRSSQWVWGLVMLALVPSLYSAYTLQRAQEEATGVPHRPSVANPRLMGVLCFSAIGLLYLLYPHRESIAPLRVLLFLNVGYQLRGWLWERQLPAEQRVAAKAAGNEGICEALEAILLGGFVGVLVSMALRY